MRVLSGVLQVVFFLVLLGAALIAAGLIANRLPLTEPPGLLTRLSAYLNTNVAETQENSPFPELRPRRYEAPPELLFDVARRAAQNLKWEITGLDAGKKEIQAVVTTKVWAGIGCGCGRPRAWAKGIWGLTRGTFSTLFKQWMRSCRCRR
jgi:hypothetical protein